MEFKRCNKCNSIYSLEVKKCPRCGEEDFKIYSPEEEKKILNRSKQQDEFVVQGSIGFGIFIGLVFGLLGAVCICIPAILGQNEKGKNVVGVFIGLILQVFIFASLFWSLVLLA